MKTKIQQRLKEIEEKGNLTILYACESGSRAWGFASPDSDYDVRFIYVKPIHWYLSIEKRKDAIDLPVDPNNIDLSGWELTKTLALFRKSNGPLLEWLQSPIVYLDKGNFRERLWELSNQYSAQKALIHHYLGIAKNSFLANTDTFRIKIKRYFYILRPLLAAKWVVEQQTPAPTAFSKLLDLLANQPKILHIIEELLEEKAAVGESHYVNLNQQLEAFIGQTFTQCEEAAKELPTTIHQAEPLNEFLRTLIKEHDTTGLI